jgi:serine/threonine-protein kinase
VNRRVPGDDGNLVGTLLDGRYRVGSMLARGGMSTVYHGIDTRLERPVAIKVMDPRFAADPAFLQRFEREARAAARLDHPGIVGVYDQGVDSTTGHDHAFLVMELVDGGTLRDLLRARGSLPVPLAVSVADRVLAALAAAHRAGLVHRDVKPENVLIGPGGVLKVADFGLVRAAAEASSSTGDLILGTVAYLAPEQVTTGRADPRSDVYATGVLLFEMLTGAPPYTGETALSVAYRHVNDDVPAPSAVGVAIPAPLNELVVQATRRDPAARPADAAAFRSVLRQVRAELGIGLVPVPLPAAAPVLAGAPARGTGADRGTVVAAAGAPAGTRAVVAAPPASHGPRGTRALTRTAIPAVEPPDDDPYQRERSRNRRAFLIWVLVVLLLAGAVGVAAWWLGSGRWTVVPDLTGLQRAAVAAKLTEADLDATLTADHNDTVPDGIVITSDPEPGHRTVRGTEVTVVLSLGHPFVPSLPVGMSVAEAQQAITEADLSPRSDPAAAEFHDTVPEGTLIGLQPGPGTRLTVGAPVTLVISKGPAPTVIPEVRGLRESEAVAALSRAGLTTQVQREFDDEIPGGQAIGTDPAAGQETGHGSDVILLVSTALVVPDVLGQPREQALAALTRAGFEPEERGDGAGQPAAVVLSVRPDAGALVAPSDNRVTVHLTTQLVVPDVVGLSVDRARQVLAAAGLDSKVSQIFGDSSSRVVKQFPGAGRPARPGTTVRLLTF